MAKPTPWQRETIRTIVHLTETKGHAPTRQELAKRFGIAPSAVQCRLRVLQRKGLVSWVPRMARTLRVTEEGRAYV